MMGLSSEKAESLALQAFVRLAAEDDLLMRFSALTGILPNDMREAAHDPGFLVGVLDFYLSHEPDLLEWCEADNIDPESVAKARFTLAPEDQSGFQ